MIRLARLAIRRPVAALLSALVVCGSLTLIGLGISESVSPSVTTVPGTNSARAEHLAEAEFGPSVLVPVLLEGPREQVDRQGPRLVRALTERGDTRVLSAWDAGEPAKQLRPRPTAAMIVASVARTEEEMVKTHQEQIEALVDKTIGGPVEASVTGQPSIDKAMQDESIDSLRRTLPIALAILFVVLLVLLRAPVAALAITVLGAGTSFSGLGITALLGKVMDVDAITALLGSMTGLVLGAGYGFMFYRRWRDALDERGIAHDAAAAASEAVQTTGRAILIGGTAMVVGDVVASTVGPTEVLTSLFVNSTLCATLAIGAAVVVMPAALVLLGDRTQALSFGAPAALTRAWDRLAGGERVVMRGAVWIGALATALLLVLAIPVLSLKDGPPSPKYLPEDNEARQSFERVAAVMGPGWPTPYNIVVVSDRGPITSAEMLAQLDRFQADIAKDPRVDSVVGPGVFAATSEDLGILPEKLRESTKLLKGGKRDLGRLEGGLGKAGAGAVQLQSGLEKARSGAAQISGGLTQALAGAEKLRAGSAAALTGSQKISGGLGQAVEPVKAGAPIVRNMAGDVAASSSAVDGAQSGAAALNGQIADAQAELAALPESPEKTAALNALASARQAAGGLEATLTETKGKLAGASGVANAFASQVAELSAGLSQLYAGSTQLTNGIGQLKDGNASLAAGIDRLSGGGGQLAAGITALRDGAGQLETGLGRLTGGAGQLATGLAAGTGPTGQLASGLGRLESGVATFRRELPSPEDLERLQRESPGLFNSGYFVLAAIAGAPEAQQNQASFAVNLEQGGNAGQIVVTSKFASDATQTRELGEDLADEVDQFAATTKTEAALGGPAGSLGDFRSEGASLIWPVILAVSLVAFLLLSLFLRAVVLPAVAVAFDVLTAAAAFGVMTVLFSGDDPILGGPGYLDPVSVIAAFTALFGMTIMYETQLLSRTRDAFMATGDPEGALRYGLSQTAAAATGAAIVMLSVIVPFAVNELIVARQLGVGVAVVVLLDALVVRPVLLPAAVEVLGRASWWPASRRAPHPPHEEPPRAEPPRHVETVPTAHARTAT